ncbi:alpha/beta hydrolase [Xanthobacter sp. KR7-225]|uniref:alpha/beta hydrolase n=1 Tax=Xanthobacter sp. KR7-225 TaxID=3156613 RepID=UPI0032B4916A
MTQRRMGFGTAGRPKAPARARLWALAGFGLLALSACARPEGVLVPVAVSEVPGTRVDMLVATTRAPSAVTGVVFSGERGDGLAFADVAVSVPRDRPIGSVQWPSGPNGDPAREFVVTRLDQLQRTDIPAWFKARHGQKRRVLVFVHGFNTRFDAAVFGYAQFIADTDASLVPVLFSWPSRGRVTDYVYDRESANFSRSDLAYVLGTAAASPKVDEVVVMAHSMGAWLAVEALRQLALKDGRVPAKITNVVLASPDLDIDVFERQMQELGPKRPKITIFVSRNDKALSLSRLLAGQVTRVGAVDLNDPRYAARLERARGITVVDLTALQGGDALNHSVFATQKDIVQLIGARLSGGQDLGEEQGLVARVGGDVGSAVGAVAVAPILVFSGGGN